MPAGWRSVICEHWPDLPAVEHGSRGQVSIVQTLSPSQPDPTAQQLDDIAATFARSGGYATARVIAKFWFGPVVLTPEQQRALAGLP